MNYKKKYRTLFLLIFFSGMDSFLSAQYYPNIVIDKSVLSRENLSEVRCYVRSLTDSLDTISFHLLERYLIENKSHLTMTLYMKNDSIKPAITLNYKTKYYYQSNKMEIDKNDFIIREKSGMITAWGTLNDKRDTVFLQKYFYDSNGKLIQSSIKSDGAEWNHGFYLNETRYYEYTNDGLPYRIRAYSYAKDGKLKWKTLSEYRYVWRAGSPN